MLRLYSKIRSTLTINLLIFLKSANMEIKYFWFLDIEHHFTAQKKSAKNKSGI